MLTSFIVLDHLFDIPAKVLTIIAIPKTKTNISMAVYI